MHWTKSASCWGGAVVATVALMAPVTAADLSGRWLHVVVNDGSNGGESVKVHLPLSVVESVLPMVEDEHLHGGKVRVGDSDVDMPDLRLAWQGLRDAPDGNFVTVDGSDGKVRVGKAKGFFLVHVDEGDEDGAKVEVKLPLKAVDALFSGKTDELDVMAALRALSDGDAGDIVRVTDGSDNVRIWVDSRQAE
jgi:hypothetical protein